MNNEYNRTVKFFIHYKANYGQSLAIIGVENWENFILLKWNEGDIWSV